MAAGGEDREGGDATSNATRDRRLDKMARYAQLYETVGESKDIGRLIETNPLAASLFMISLARADVYGILPADPWDFRTKVCPAAAVPAIAEFLGCFRAEEKLDEVTVDELMFGDWSDGRYVWQLQLRYTLSAPIPATGKQGLWEWDAPEWLMRERELAGFQS